MTTVVFCKWLRTFRGGLTGLRSFLDSLDSVAGADGDTGTNALATLISLEERSKSLHDLPLNQLLTVLSGHALSQCHGSIGLFMAHAFLKLSQLQYPSWRPVELAGALRGVFKNEDELVTYVQKGGVGEVAAAVNQALTDLPDQFDLAYIADTASFAAQDSLIETGRGRLGVVDPGGAVIVVALAALASTISGEEGRLFVASQMLVDLASDVPGRGQRPARDAEFEISFMLRGTRSDKQKLVGLYQRLKVNATIVGYADVFGVGQWQVNARTGTPLVAIPGEHSLSEVVIRHVRPEQTQVSEPILAPPGVSLLERRPSAPPAQLKTTLVVLTRVAGLVDEMARSGALVILNPTTSAALLTQTLLANDCGFAIIVPGDKESAIMAREAQVAVQACADVSGSFKKVVVAPTSDELAALALVRRWFETSHNVISQELALSDYEAALARAALTRTVTVDPDSGDLVDAVTSLLEVGDESLQVLLGQGHGPTVSALISSALQLVDGHQSIEIIQGGQSGPVVLGAVRR